MAGRRGVKVLVWLLVINVGLLAVLHFNHGLWRELDTSFCRLDLPLIWRVEDSAPVQSGNGYSRYESGPLGFSYPTVWKISAEVFSGGEILHHTAFWEPGQGAHGFVQVWRLAKPLDQFIEEAANSQINGETISFQQTPRPVAGRPGRLLEYRRPAVNGEEYLAREVFCQEGERLYRLSFFVPAKADQERYEQIFNHMVDSLQVNP